MPTIDGAFINGLLSTPLVLPASVAGALAALFVVIIVLAVRRAATGGGARLLVPLHRDRDCGDCRYWRAHAWRRNERMAEQRALLLRHTQLSLSAVAPGSALACLDGAARRADRDCVRESRVRRRAKCGKRGRLYRCTLVSTVRRICRDPARQSTIFRRCLRARAAPSNSTALASLPMSWLSAMDVPPIAAGPLPCSRTPARSRPT